MRPTLLLMLCVLVSADDAATTRSDFDDGWMLGHLQGTEMRVPDAAAALRLLEGIVGAPAERLREVEVTLLNSSLSVLAIAQRDLPVRDTWPPLVFRCATIASRNTRIAMASLRADRVAKGWTDRDPDREREIDAALAVYAEYGNAYRIVIAGVHDASAVAPPAP